MTVRLWGETRFVSLDTLDNQTSPSVTQLLNGDLLYVWSDNAEGGANIVGRRFRADGTPIGGEIGIATGAVRETAPTVVALPDGGFQVSFSTFTAPLDDPRFRVAIFNAAGQVTGQNFFNAGATPDGSSAAIPTGGAVHVFRATDAVRLFFVEADGGVSATIAASAIDAVAYEAPDITVLRNGRIVTVWSTDGDQIFGRVLEANGDALVANPGPFAISAPLAQSGQSPDIVALEDGGFVVTWTDGSGAYQDIRGRIYDADGLAPGPEFRINGVADFLQLFGDLVALRDGGFIALWFSFTPDGFSIRGQRFGPDGARVGTEFTVAAIGSPSSDRSLSATLLSDGRVAVTWDARDEGDVSQDIVTQIIDPRGGYITGTNTVSDTLYGGFFDDQILAFGRDDVVYARDGADEVRGGLGNDTLYGELGVDRLLGEDGNDILNGGAGVDLLDGGAGSDVADYRDRTGAVVLALNRAVTTSVTVGGVLEETVVNVESAYGGAGGDTLTGDGLVNIFLGYGGNDVLRGGGGRDLLIGGAGIDIVDFRDKTQAVALTLNGATSAVSTVGGALDDTVREVEVVYGGSAADTLTGDALGNSFRGGGGADLIDGAGGLDSIDFREKTTPVVLALNGATLATATIGGVAEDRVRNVEIVYGGAGNDTLTGDALANQLLGGGGKDILRGAGGADRLTGGAAGDLFAYFAIGESTVAVAGRDTILDFRRAELDKIGLNAIDANTGVAGDQAFVLGALGVAGRLLVSANGAGSWLVQGDVNGGGADFAMVVNSPTAPVATDFLL